jgi:iron complex transport system substrate-binding protein
MKRQTVRRIVAIAALGLLSQQAIAAPIRVVSQSVGTDELLLALAEPNQIAALSHIAHDPQFSAVATEASRYPTINQGDAETILRFDPTLVLFADYSRIELVSQVSRTGTRVIVFDRYATIEDAYANLRALGAAINASGKAEDLIAQCVARVDDLERKLRNARPVRVITPSTYGITAGRDTTFQDLCDHAGAENVAATIGGLTGHATAPVEQMLTWPVEQVVVTGNSLEETLDIFRKVPPYQFMPAVIAGRAILLKPYMLSCVSHHRIDAYELLARGLHPERFEN